MAASAYVALEELTRFGLPESELTACTEQELQTAIEIASSEADTYLAAFYSGHLTTYPPALKKHVTSAIRKHLWDLKTRHIQGDDEIIQLNYSAAISFYKSLQRSQQKLPAVDTAPAAAPVIVVSSSEPRGW